MGFISLEIEVDGTERTVKALKRGVKRGLEDAGETIIEQGEEIAQDEVVAARKVWTGQVKRGFDSRGERVNFYWSGSVWNLAKHADVVDRGLAPAGEITGSNPSVQDLMPWVVDNLSPANYDPPDRDDNPGNPADDDAGSGFGSVPLLDGDYAGEPGFINSEGDQLSQTSFYIGQDVVIYDTLDERYIRKEVIGFDQGLNIRDRVPVVEIGGQERAQNLNNTDFVQMAGYRDFDSLSRSEKIGVIEDHWDIEIDGGAEDWIDTQSETLSDVGLETMPESRKDFARSFWFSEVENMIRDVSEFRDATLNIRGIAQQEDHQGSVAGSISDINSGRGALFSLLSESNVKHLANKNISHLDGDFSQEDVKETILHEATHAWSDGADYGLGLDPDDYPKLDQLVKHLEVDKSGKLIKQSSFSNSKPLFINSVQEMFFQRSRDTSVDAGNVGGDDWIEELLSVASSEDAMRDYSPDLIDTSSREKLYDAANRAWLLQVVNAQERKKNNNDPTKLFINRSYNVTSPRETLTGLTEQMSDFSSSDLEKLDKYYPWFIEAWLENFTPREERAEKLQELGYDV